MRLSAYLEEEIVPRHSAEVREWWNMRDGSPVKGAWNFYFGRHPELGDHLLLRMLGRRSAAKRERKP